MARQTVLQRFNAIHPGQDITKFKLTVGGTEVSAHMIVDDKHNVLVEARDGSALPPPATATAPTAPLPPAPVLPPQPGVAPAAPLPPPTAATPPIAPPAPSAPPVAPQAAKAAAPALEAPAAPPAPHGTPGDKIAATLKTEDAKQSAFDQVADSNAKMADYLEERAKDVLRVADHLRAIKRDVEIAAPVPSLPPAIAKRAKLLSLMLETVIAAAELGDELTADKSHKMLGEIIEMVNLKKDKTVIDELKKL